MKYKIDKTSDKSAYMQIYHQIRDDIVNRVYKYGDRLPSKRILAEETITSVITVEHAYDILCDEGYIESRERRGYFVSYRRESFAPTSENEISLFPAPHFHDDESFPLSVYMKTMRNVMAKYGESIMVKSPNTGVYELKKSIVDYLARGKGIKVNPEQLVIGSGAEYLYGLIVQLAGRDKIYALENPSYEKIRLIYEANGVCCDMLRLGSDGILSSELKKTNGQILHVTPVRSYPTGISASASKRHEYISWAKERNALIIEDDFDSEFTILSKNEDTLFSLEPKKTVIYINTFTKTVASSMRVGYMILPEDLLSTFSAKTGFYSCTVPTFEQYVLAELIANGDFERHINRVRRKRRQSMKDTKA